ncbi:MAG: hypothetical protein FD138_4050 [Planctomycetota bacterium]|nr:MAG: hypothetical protein FD138_4050 [Planctomycetota bacterium]
MGVRQTRLFVQSNEAQSDWAETLIGRVFRPLTTEFAESLHWFWFSRYGSSADDSGDCDIAQIPAEYKQPVQPGDIGYHRSMRFRFSISDDRQPDFERRGQQLINDNGYRISDFRPYDYVGDTGNNRFLGTENRQPGRAEQRAILATNFYAAISRLVIDALVGPDDQGRYRIESNDDQLQNPRGSTFQSLLHLFCNITNVPTDIYVFHKAALNLIGYGTFIYPPPSPPGDWDGMTPFPIRY